MSDNVRAGHPADIKGILTELHLNNASTQRTLAVNEKSSSRLLQLIVISRYEIRDRGWSNACHVMCNNFARFHQCSVMFPGNMASHDSRSRGTWCKTPDNMHLC